MGTSLVSIHYEMCGCNATFSSIFLALLRNGIHGAQNGALSVKSNHHRLSSFGEYRMEDLEHTKLTIDAHSPPVSMIERDFPLVSNKFK